MNKITVELYKELLQFITKLLKEADTNKNNFNINDLLKNTVMLSSVKGAYCICDIFLNYYNINKLYSALYGNFMNRFLLENYINYHVISTINKIKNTDFKYITLFGRKEKNGYWLFEFFKKKQTIDVPLNCLAKIQIYDLMKTKIAAYKEKDIFKEYNNHDDVKLMLFQDSDIKNILEKIFYIQEESDKKSFISELYKDRRSSWDGEGFKIKVDFLRHAEQYLGKEKVYWVETLYEKYCNFVHGGLVHFMDTLTLNSEKENEFYSHEAYNHLVVGFPLLCGVVGFYDEFCLNNKNELEINTLIEKFRSS